MFQSTFYHPTFGECKIDRSKIAIRWCDGASAAERSKVIAEHDLVPLAVPSRDAAPSREKGGRPLRSVNNSASLTWVELQGGGVISEKALAELERSPLVQWIAYACRAEKSVKELESLFCVNPTRVYLTTKGATALGDLAKLGDLLAVDVQRTARLHNLVAFTIPGVSLVAGNGAIAMAGRLAVALEAHPSTTVARDLLLENIPLMSPTCGCGAAPAGLVPNDPLFPVEWGLQRINAPHGWTLTSGDPGVVVAVIDQGVELLHPDLDVHPQSWNASSDVPDGGPVGNHGTPCAGIVAARFGNGLGGAGVAPRCRVMAIATSTWADIDIAEGLYFAADHGARVVSMSFGVYAEWNFWNFDVIRDALQYAEDRGLVLVAASGNENGSTSRFPGSDARTICVGGSSRDDTRKQVGDSSSEPFWGACYGADLDVVAPCLEIPTTDRLGAFGYSATDYTLGFNGTSAATPHVAGLAALILSLRGDLANESVREIIERTCDKISPSTYTYSIVPHKRNGTWSEEVGYGRINVERALTFACSYGKTSTCEGPCAVDLPEIPPECQSPAAPPWLPLEYCLTWYEGRAVAVDRIPFRVIYEHHLCLLGRQQGPLLFTTTLLPGETVRLFHSERYRRTRSSREAYSIHTSYRQTVAALQQSRNARISSTYQDLLVKIRSEGDTTVTVGGLLFPAGWNAEDHSTSLEHHESAGVQSVAESFVQTLSTASQQIEAERSIVVSTYEDAEVRDVTARTLHNANDCRAVTYFVRQVYEAYEVSTRVVDILWRYPDRVKDPGRGIDDWRSVRHMEDVEPEIREAVEKALRRLPRLGEIFKEPRRLTVPTDGTIYQSELSHCSSCEPQREAAALLSLERANAETRKACLEVQLLELEIQRRKRLLESGDLTPFLTDAPKASS